MTSVRSSTSLRPRCQGMPGGSSAVARSTWSTRRSQHNSKLLLVAQVLTVKKKRRVRGRHIVLARDYVADARRSQTWKGSAIRVVNAVSVHSPVVALLYWRLQVAVPTRRRVFKKDVAKALKIPTFFRTFFFRFFHSFLYYQI